MSTAKHTPGPWKVDRQVRTSINAKSKHIAMVSFFRSASPDASIDIEEHEANCSLIAASPELYEALERMVKLFAYCDCHHADCTECEKFEFARAALAKARGEA